MKPNVDTPYSYGAGDARESSGTDFVQPETRGGVNATFLCPPGRKNETVYRYCGAGGVWQSFDEGGCGVVLGDLNRLNDSFSNLSLDLE